MTGKRIHKNTNQEEDPVKIHITGEDLPD